jgi:hypothetical protein
MPGHTWLRDDVHSPRLLEMSLGAAASTAERRVGSTKRRLRCYAHGNCHEGSADGTGDAGSWRTNETSCLTSHSCNHHSDFERVSLAAAAIRLTPAGQSTSNDVTTQQVGGGMIWMRYYSNCTTKTK